MCCGFFLLWAVLNIWYLADNGYVQYFKPTNRFNIVSFYYRTTGIHIIRHWCLTKKLIFRTRLEVKSWFVWCSDGQTLTISHRMCCYGPICLLMMIDIFSDAVDSQWMEEETSFFTYMLSSFFNTYGAVNTETQMTFYDINLLLHQWWVYNINVKMVPQSFLIHLNFCCFCINMP